MSPKRLALLASALTLTLLLTAPAPSQEAAPDPQSGTAVKPSAKPEPKPAADDRKRVLTRVYDIRDLLIVRREYRADSALVPPTRIGERRAAPAAAVAARPGGEPSTRPVAVTAPEALRGPTRTREELVEEIQTLLQETVDPDNWRDNGGKIGAMRELQGQLIVTQTDENHRQLVSLFEQLRRTHARMATVRAEWVFLSPAELRAVARPMAEDPAVFEVDVAALDKLGDGKRAHLRGQVTCVNAQTVHVAAGRARTVVTEQVPVVGADALGYEPHGSVVQDGTLLEVTPVLSPDGQRVFLDLQSVVSSWAPEPTAAAGAGEAAPPREAADRPGVVVGEAGAATPAIDRVDIGVQQMRMSLALPTGRPILVGGMTFDAGPDASEGQMYLVIEVLGSPQSLTAH